MKKKINKLLNNIKNKISYKMKKMIKNKFVKVTMKNPQQNFIIY
jgi:uncharacterized FlaG/YvyC family protein